MGAGADTGPTTAGPAGGKNATAQNLMSPHAGLKSTITKGDPMARSMGQYAKAPKPGAVAHGLTQIRGGQGVMKRTPRQGGLGPGKMSTPGTPSDYSMTSPDQE